MRKYVKPIVCLLGASVTVGAAAPGSAPQGRWLTEEKSAIVEIFRCAGGDTLCGRLVWFRPRPDDPNRQGLDVNNPDPARRDQSLCGYTFMYGFKPAEPDVWKDGAVYDPNNGHTYNATMTLQPDGTLRLRGYIGISLIGSSEVWTPYTQTVPSCPPE